MLARVPYAGLARAAGVLGGVLAAGTGRAVTLPEDSAEAMLHVYKGGGLTASGPALLVRKSMADKVSLSASYYVDAVSSASIDVVTTASPYKETRKEVGFGADYVVRDSQITLSASNSKEPDYQVSSAGIDVSQETFGGMTTVTMGTTRSSDKVGRKGNSGYFDGVTHWQYRLGVTQILTPRWLMSANFEAIADDGFLASPYRVARVFGAAVPERLPRTRSSRAIALRTTVTSSSARRCPTSARCAAGAATTTGPTDGASRSRRTACRRRGSPASRRRAFGRPAPRRVPDPAAGTTTPTVTGPRARATARRPAARTPAARWRW